MWCSGQQAAGSEQQVAGSEGTLLELPAASYQLCLTQFTPPQLAIHAEHVLDDPDRVGRAHEVLDDNLLVLERLVVLEEAPDLAQQVARELPVLGVFAEGGIFHADGDDLVVEALLVAHPHDADRPGLHQRQWCDRFLPEHQDVEWVAVFAVGSRNESVVGGVVDCAVKYAVKPQQARFLVQLVLVLAAHGHLDDHGECRRYQMVIDVDVMPRMHSRILSSIVAAALTLGVAPARAQSPAAGLAQGDLAQTSRQLEQLAARVGPAVVEIVTLGYASEDVTDDEKGLLVAPS